MTNGKPQHQAHSSSGALPNRSGDSMENAAASGSPSNSLANTSVGRNSDNNIQNRPLPAHVSPEQKDSTISVQTPDPRPPLVSREFSANLVHEIRQVIRQEFAYTLNEHSRKTVSEDGDVSPTTMDVGSNSQEKKLSRPRPTVESVQGDSEDDSDQESDDGSCSPTTMPGSSSDRTTAGTLTPNPSPSSTVSVPSLSLASPTATRPDTTRPGVRFSDNTPLVHSPVSGQAPAPTRRASWAMYRRTSSSSGEPVPEWGVLFDGNGFATPRWGQAEEFPPRAGVVITPEKLGLLYSRFRIEGEAHPFEDIFHILWRQESQTGGLVNYHDRINDFFADLDCEYYLVPPSTHEVDSLARSPSASSVSSASPASPLSSPAFSHPRPSPSFMQAALQAAAGANVHRPSPPRPRSARPSVPALTLEGFVQFFTICALAHPDEEARRLNKIASELALVIDPGPTNAAMIPSSGATSMAMSPLATSSPTQGVPPPLPSPTGLASGWVAGRGERLPRQFVRSLLPVKPDPKSRKLLAAAVEDLLCDLGVSHSPTPSPGSRSLVPIAQTPRSSVPTLQFAEPNRRWSFANVPTDATVHVGSGWGGKVPHLPPPPVPLPRSGGAGRGGSGPSPLKPLPSSSSAGSLAGFQTAAAASRSPGAGADPSSTALVGYRPHRQHHARQPHHEHRRYPSEVVIQPHPPPAPTQKGSSTAVALRSRNRETRFELGDGDEDDSASSGTASTVATITARPPRTDRRSSYHGQEYERDRGRWWGAAQHRDRERNREREYDARERERERDKDRGRDRDRDRERERERERNRSYERRPALPPAQFSDRRRSSAAIAGPGVPVAGSTPSSPTATRASSISTGAAGGRDGVGAGALVVAHPHDERGPTWSEVKRAQQQQQQQQTPPPPQKVKSVSFYDERHRAYAP
ncbi:hypothetical protein GGS24DRAFT_518537 [Hypoxylon argillaceum]|nr:hypothetical protein GGS24DRAFT_518537 [Hypoxylon argillaceum]